MRPILSIITVTYNAEEFIQRTLDSIRMQTNQSFEYVVIDGASRDNTLRLIEEHGVQPDFLISEPDRGLYDAMDKGLAKASGEFVWFLNAGDEIASTDVVEKLLPILASGVDVVYSDTWMVNNEGKVLGLRSELLPHKVPEILMWQKFKMGMLVCHQSFIARKSIAPNYMKNNLSADIDWEILCLKNARAVQAFPGIIAKYLIGGLSNKRQFKSWKDRYLVLQKHFGVIPNFLNHIAILIRAVLR